METRIILICKNSGGGITIFDGDPMYQFEVAYWLLKVAKEKELRTCMEPADL